MFKFFTDKARKVMALAKEEARRMNHEYLGTEHILLGIVREYSGIAAEILKEQDIGLRKIRQEVDKIMMRGPEKLAARARIPLTPHSVEAVRCASKEAKRLGHKYVGTEHLLLGLIQIKKGVALQILTSLGCKPEKVVKTLTAILSK